MVWDSRKDNADTQRLKNLMFCGLYSTNRIRDVVLFGWPIVAVVLSAFVLRNCR